MNMPENPKIFHIMHVDHLASVINDEKLFSDAFMTHRSDYGTNIAMSHIKARRMAKVVGHTNYGYVGEYVPFYFRPRSMMLFVISQKKHPSITYREGQNNVIHLVSQTDTAIQWAHDNDRNWAFTDRNASTGYVRFFHDKASLNQLRWDVMDTKYYANDPATREAVQSEFLMKDDFPWELIDEIVVHSDDVKIKVDTLLLTSNHKPLVRVEKRWYY